jgi:uncharacterized repeat protein (TIGR01451 family)
MKNFFTMNTKLTKTIGQIFLLLLLPAILWGGEPEHPKNFAFRQMDRLKESFLEKLTRRGFHQTIFTPFFAAEICNNNLDDDGDGLIDAADPDCGANILQTIPAGSYIINMGAQPQTVNNALKPYGLVWHLLHYFSVPVKWAINPDKAKDEVDFTYDGVGYRGGPFIVTAEFRTPSVDSLIEAWETKGVVGVNTSSDFQAPINRTINYSMNWTLNLQNGGIAEDYLLKAGIPENAYNWVLPQYLNCCNDVFLMPHSEPVWSSHNRLLSWNNSEANGGCGGAIWAGCKSGSQLENIVNPANTAERMNFLMRDPQAPATTPAVWSDDHKDGTIPPPYQYSYHSHPIMQFLGLMDGAQEGGAEQIYLPRTGWRPSTFTPIWDHDHPEIPSLSPGPAAKIAFGPAFGDSSRGYIMYQGGHELDKANLPANIAAQRAFFNFSFLAVGKKAIHVTANIPAVLQAGDAFILTAGATGGSGNYVYSWSSTCGGTFSNPHSSTTSFTPANANVAYNCYIKVTVTDDCGVRVGFERRLIKVKGRPAPPVAVDDYAQTQPGTPVVINALSNDSDPNLDPLTLTSFLSNANTGNGTFTNNGDGKVTYLSRFNFIGTDQIRYRICDDTPPTSGGPLCDTATIYVTVNWIDPNGCYPDEYYGILTQGNATVMTAQSSITNPSQALNAPALVASSNSYYAKIDNDADYLVLDLGYDVPVGDTIYLYIGSDDAALATLQVKGTLTGINYATGADFYDLKSYSTSKDLNDANPQQDIVAYVPVTGKVRKLRFVRAAGAGKPCVNGVRYVVYGCLSAVPVANNDAITLCEDNTVDINVLANDTDPRGQALTPGIVTPPLNGIATVQPDGTIRYKPNADYSGTDVFTYQACNTAGLCDPATVNITVYDDNCPPGYYKVSVNGVCSGNCILSPNNPPDAVNDYAKTFMNVPVAVGVQNNDSDPSGLGLTMTLVPNNPPDHGTAVISGKNIVYTPHPDFNGLDTFAYSICNPYGCDVALVIVDVWCVDPGSDNGIGGKVFQDANLNANYDNGETGVANIKVKLYNDADQNGQYSAGDNILDSVFTNSFGSYSFEVSPPYAFSSSTPVNLSRQISTGANDAEEYGPGGGYPVGQMYLTSTDLELVEDLEPIAGGNQKIGLRFTSISIPKNATILSAYLDFVAVAADSPNTNTGATTIAIRAQAADNAPGFSAVTDDITSRTLTTATASWSPVNWNSEVTYTSPDLKTLVQEVVNRTGWANGNSIAFIMTGTGSRSAYAYEGAAAKAPVLRITYLGQSDNPSAGTAVLAESATPSYSEWDGSAYAAKQTMPTVSANWRILQGADSPHRKEKIVVGINTLSQVAGLMWNGTAWSSLSINPLGTVSESYWWGADVAYEQNSGDAILVWNASGALKYSVWNGTSWSAPATIGTYTGTEPQQMHLEAKPGSDQLILVVNDVNADDYVMLWDGSNWEGSLSKTLIPTDDTYLTSAETGRNYGTCTWLQTTAGTENILMKFDLSSIPSNAAITSAVLKLKKSGGPKWDQTVNIYRVTNTWTQGIKCNSSATPNWKVRTGSTSWTTPGGEFNNTVMASSVVGATDTWYAWNVQSLVQGWVNNTYANQGLMLRMANGNSVTFSSKEGAGVPVLEISYTTGSGAYGTLMLDNSGSSEFDQTCLNTAYESKSGNAMVAYGKNSSPGVFYRLWNGTAWTAEASIAAPAGTTSTPRWIMMASDPSSERIVMGVVSNAVGGTVSHVWLNVWDGNAWGASIAAATNLPANASYPAVSVAFESLSGKALAVYGKSGSNNVFYRTKTGTSAWTAELTGPNVGGIPNSLEIYPNLSSNGIMLAVQDAGSDLNYVLWNGSSWGTPVELSVNTAEVKNQPFTFLWNQIPPSALSSSQGYYLMRVDPATFPLNTSLTTDNLETAVLLGSGQVDCDNNFGLTVHLPPVANPDTAYVDAGTSVVINVIANDYDPEGTPLTMTILTNPPFGTASNNGNGSLTFRPNNGFTGWQTFTYKICDQGTPSLCDTTTVSVLVSVLFNDAPVAKDDYDTTYVNIPVETDVLQNDFDQEFGVLTVNFSPGILQPANGTLVLLPGKEVEYIPNPGFTGNDSYQYIVCDNGSPVRCDTARVYIHVRNNPPDAKDDFVITDMNTPLQVKVLSNDSEPDGHDIILLSAGTNATNGATSYGGTVSLNNNGTSANPADDYVLYTPPSGFIGVDTFCYRVRDSGLPSGYDIAKVIVRVTPLIDLEMQKSVNPSTATMGQSVTFTLTLLNKGPATATNVLVQDVLTSSYVYISNNGNGAYDPVSGIWFVPNLPAGQSRTLTITATLVNGLKLKNVTQVYAADQKDLDSRPNNDDGDQSEDDEASATPFVGEICNDGIDNDGDGLADCNDPDCGLSNVGIVSSGGWSLCTGTSTVLTASATGGQPPYTFSWSNGLGSGASKTVNPIATTTYTVTVTSASGCTATTQATVTVLVNPAVNAGADVTICQGSSTTLNATGTGGSAPYTFAWSNSLGSGASKTVNPTVPTTYTVTITDFKGCTATDQVVVSVNTSPAANAGSDATICSGSSTTLSASATGGVTPYTFSWNNSLGTGAVKTVSPTGNTTYTVTVTSAQGCTGTDQVAITVLSSPAVNAGADVTICQNNNTTLTANVTGGVAPFSYNWSGGLAGSATVVAAPVVTTTYTVTVTSSNGCVATDQVVVTVNNCFENCTNGLDDDGDGLTDCADTDCKPVVSLGGGISICYGTSATLTATVAGSGTFTYNWSNGLGTGAVKTVSPASTTTYSVTVTNSTGCTGTAQVTVTVTICSEVCDNGIDDDNDGLVDCQDPDCIAIAAPQLQNDQFAVCPGVPFTERVSYNDSNLQNPAYSIFSAPTRGTVTIDGTGKFVYTPFTADCLTDAFAYQVCNQTTGCCATATVQLTIGDNTPPILVNVPADLTIDCDDAVPSPPVVLGYDACPGIYIEFDEESTEYSSGACDSYQITRTWKATDLCGNFSTDNQIITVQDMTAPEMFRVYTLANDKILAAGVARRTTGNWKYVRFPVTFSQVPLVFTQAVSTAENTTVVVQLRNISTQGFEMILQEQESSDQAHQPESVAWMAIEPGNVGGAEPLVAGLWANVNHNPQNLNFAQPFAAVPSLIANVQTTAENDPVSIRYQSLTATGAAGLFLQEETSKDAEVAHANERVGYLAFGQNQVLKGKDGRFIGESGKLILTNAWAFVPLSQRYTKPVVILGGLSNNDNAPTTLRVRNVTASSFEVRAEEWTYLNGIHSAESVSYLVVEGSIPEAPENYCAGSAVPLETGVNVFATDNCDNQVALHYNESTVTQPGQGLLATRTWTATDDCGNSVVATRLDTCGVAALKVKALAYGAVVNNGGGNLMRDDLRKQTLVPVKEPYSDLPGYPHVAKPTRKVTICHHPGQPDQQTMVVSGDDLAMHLSHGDVMGTCTLPPATPPPAAVNAQYRTIANGSWSSAATWKSGNIPPTGNVNNLSISIEHNVNLQNSDLLLKNGSRLYITNGQLSLGSGNIQLQGSFLMMDNASINVTGYLHSWTGPNEVRIKNSQVTVGTHFSHESGLRKMENTCVSTGTDFIRGYSSGVVDTLVNVTAIVQGHFKNYFSGSMHLSGCKFKVVNGDFLNAAGNSLTGSNFTLLVEKGNVLNDGTWSLQVAQYCIAGTKNIPLQYLPVTGDCANINNWFVNCNPSAGNIVYVNSGSGSGGGGSTEQEIPNTGIGVLNPVLLQVSGNQAIVDWMLVEIRNPGDDRDIVGYATVVIKRDGSIMVENGDSVIVFKDLPENDYYVSIRHRNHLGMMTNLPIYLTAENPPLVDFTDPALPLRGSATAGRMFNGKRMMWGGDFNEDGKVIYQGPFNDVFFLFSRVLADPKNTENLANYIVPGYELNDFNLDGKVIYQGPNNDRAPLLYHTVLSHPDNTALLANFIAVHKLP